MIVRRVVYLCVLIVSPLHPLVCQQATVNPQRRSPKSSASSTLIVGFGPTVSNAEGKQAIEKLLQALGGATKVNAVKTLRQTVVATEQGRHIYIEQSIVYPDKQAALIKMPQGRVLTVVTPNDAFLVTGGQAQDLPPDQRASLDAVSSMIPSTCCNILTIRTTSSWRPASNRSMACKRPSSTWKPPVFRPGGGLEPMGDFCGSAQTAKAARWRP